MKNKKKLFILLGLVTNIIIFIVSIVIIGYFLFMAYVFGGYPYEKTKVSISNNSKNEIVIFQKYGRGFFGPSDVIIKANNKSFNRYINIHIYKTQIYDDGGRGSVAIQWKDNDTAFVTLSGCEMDKKTIKIEFINNKIKFFEEKMIIDY